MSRWRSSKSDVPLQINVGAHDGSLSAALHALREALGQAPKRARVKVCLADCWVRYRCLPWREALTLEAAWSAYAQQMFANAAMPLDEGWTLMLLPLRYGAPRLALALKAELVAELAAELAAGGVAELTLTTKFLDVMQTVRAQPQATVGVLDEGRLTMARLHDGEVQAVQSLRFNVGDQDAAHVLARQRAMLEGEAPSSALQLYALGVKDTAHALPAENVTWLELNDVQAPWRGPIRWPTHDGGHAPRMQAAVALLLPLMAMAMVLALLRGQTATLTAQREATTQSASTGDVTLVAREAARAEALVLAQWLWPQWEQPLNAVHAAWPAGFRATRLQVDGARGALRLEGRAPDLAQVNVLATQVPGATVTQMALESARPGASARFELSVPSGPAR